MTNHLQTVKRATIALIVATFGIGLFATGVWAGSTNDGRPSTDQARGSFWNFDPQTGNPMGPAGQLDFWNYDPATGAKISDFPPAIAPNDLAALWSWVVEGRCTGRRSRPADWRPSGASSHSLRRPHLRRAPAPREPWIFRAQFGSPRRRSRAPQSRRRPQQSVGHVPVQVASRVWLTSR